MKIEDFEIKPKAKKKVYELEDDVFCLIKVIELLIKQTKRGASK